MNNFFAVWGTLSHLSTLLSKSTPSSIARVFLILTVIFFYQLYWHLLFIFVEKVLQQNMSRWSRKQSSRCFSLETRVTRTEKACFPGAYHCQKQCSLTWLMQAWCYEEETQYVAKKIISYLTKFRYKQGSLFLCIKFITVLMFCGAIILDLQE